MLLFLLQVFLCQQLHQGFAQSIPDRLPPLHWPHIIVGQFNPENLNAKVQGYHSTCLPFPDRSFEIKHELANGVFLAKWMDKNMGIGRESTFFPRSWNCKKLFDKFTEAYDHILSVRYSPNESYPDGIVAQGVTKEGVVIEFVLVHKHHNSIGNEFIFAPEDGLYVITAYPLLSESVRPSK